MKRYIKRKKKKTQFEETVQASESDIARTLELSDWKFRTTIINIVRVLGDKVDSMQEQMRKASRDENPKKTPKRIARGGKKTTNK